MNYKNVRFKWGNGKFVESSKEPSEGFEKITYEDPKTKAEKVTYHRYLDTVEGIISSVGVNETRFGNFLRVNVKTGKDTITSIQVPLENQYGYSRETRALISSLRGYELGQAVIIKPVVKSFKRKNGADGKDINFYFNYVNKQGEDGKSESTGFIAFSELPPLEVEEKRGKKIFNNEKQQDFYYETLQTIIKNFNDNWENRKNSTTTTTTEKTAVLEPNTGFEDEFNEDELPF